MVSTHRMSFIVRIVSAGCVLAACLGGTAFGAPLPRPADGDGRRPVGPDPAAMRIEFRIIGHATRGGADPLVRVTGVVKNVGLRATGDLVMMSLCKTDRREPNPGAGRACALRAGEEARVWLDIPWRNSFRKQPPVFLLKVDPYRSADVNERNNEVTRSGREVDTLLRHWPHSIAAPRLDRQEQARFRNPPAPPKSKRASSVRGSVDSLSPQPEPPDTPGKDPLPLNRRIRRK